MAKANKRKTGLKAVSVFVAVVFSLTGIVYPQSSFIPAAISQEAMPLKLIPGKVTIPAEMGSIQSEFHGGDKAPFVVFIQDAHAVCDAQTNIRNLIRHFSESYGVSLVAVEGGKGKLDPTLLRAFPVREIKEKIMAEYCDRGEAAGSEMAAVLNFAEAGYFGIEDWELYEAHYVAYLRAMKNQGALLKALGEKREELDRARAGIYSAEHSEFHEKVTTFRAGKMSLIDFLKFLKERAPEVASPELRKLMDSIAADDSMDRESLEVEVRWFADEFGRQHSQKLGKEQAKEFNGRYQELVTGRTDAGTFLKYLIALSEEAGVRLDVTASMKELLEHRETLDSVKGTKVFDELEAFLAESESRYSTTEEERALAERYGRLDLLGDMAKLELTREKVEKYQRSPGEFLSLLPEPGLVRAHLDFYRYALVRDEVLGKNLEELMKREKKEAAIVILGGFHRSGFEKRLAEQGISYCTVTPKINSLAGAENYGPVMQGRLSYGDSAEPDFYEAFMRQASRKLAEGLSEPEFRKTLKEWRDTVLRGLAEEGRLAEAHRYTHILDLLIRSYIEKFGAGNLTEKNKAGILLSVKEELERSGEKALEEARARAEAWVKNFSEGLRELAGKKRIAPASVKDLMDRNDRPVALAIPVIKFISGLNSEVLSLVVRNHGQIPAETLASLSAKFSPPGTLLVAPKDYYVAALANLAKGSPASLSRQMRTEARKMATMIQRASDLAERKELKTADVQAIDRAVEERISREENLQKSAFAAAVLEELGWRVTDGGLAVPVKVVSHVTAAAEIPGPENAAASLGSEDDSMRIKPSPPVYGLSSQLPKKTPDQRGSAGKQERKPREEAPKPVYLKPDILDLSPEALALMERLRAEAAQGTPESDQTEKPEGSSLGLNPKLLESDPMLQPEWLEELAGTEWLGAIPAAITAIDGKGIRRAVSVKNLCIEDPDTEEGEVVASNVADVVRDSMRGLEGEDYIYAATSDFSVDPVDGPTHWYRLAIVKAKKFKEWAYSRANPVLVDQDGFTGDYERNTLFLVEFRVMDEKQGAELDLTALCRELQGKGLFEPYYRAACQFIQRKFSDPEKYPEGVTVKNVIASKRVREVFLSEFPDAQPNTDYGDSEPEWGHPQTFSVKIGGAKSGRTTAGDGRSLGSTVDFMKIAEAEDFNPETLIAAMKKNFPELRELYAGRTWIEEEERDDGAYRSLYTVEAHTLRVMRLFEKYFGKMELPGGVSKGIFRIALALHDIGKSRAVPESGISQHDETFKVVKGMTFPRGYDKQIPVILALIYTNFPEPIPLEEKKMRGDPIGRYLKLTKKDDATPEDLKETPPKSARAIRDKAAEAGLETGDFFRLLTVYYQCDAASYTKAAGGVEALELVFLDPDEIEAEEDFKWMEEDGRLRFSAWAQGAYGEIEKELDSLKQALLPGGAREDFGERMLAGGRAYAAWINKIGEGTDPGMDKIVMDAARGEIENNAQNLLPVIHPEGGARDLTVYVPAPGFNFSKVMAATDATTLIYADLTRNYMGSTKIDNFQAIVVQIDAMGGKIDAEARNQFLESPASGRAELEFEFPSSVDGALRKRTLVYYTGMDATRFIPPEIIDGYDVLWLDAFPLFLDLGGGKIRWKNESGYLIPLLNDGGFAEFGLNGRVPLREAAAIRRGIGSGNLGDILEELPVESAGQFESPRGNGAVLFRRIPDAPQNEGGLSPDAFELTPENMILTTKSRFPSVKEMQEGSQSLGTALEPEVGKILIDSGTRQIEFRNHMPVEAFDLPGELFGGDPAEPVNPVKLLYESVRETLWNRGMRYDPLISVMGSLTYVFDDRGLPDWDRITDLDLRIHGRESFSVHMANDVQRILHEKLRDKMGPERVFSAGAGQVVMLRDIHGKVYPLRLFFTQVKALFEPEPEWLRFRLGDVFYGDPLALRQVFDRFSYFRGDAGRIADEIVADTEIYFGNNLRRLHGDVVDVSRPESKILKRLYRLGWMIGIEDEEAFLALKEEAHRLKHIEDAPGRKFSDGDFESFRRHYEAAREELLGKIREKNVHERLREKFFEISPAKNGATKVRVNRIPREYFSIFMHEIGKMVQNIMHAIEVDAQMIPRTEEDVRGLMGDLFEAKQKIRELINAPDGNVRFEDVEILRSQIEILKRDLEVFLGQLEEKGRSEDEADRATLHSEIAGLDIAEKRLDSFGDYLVNGNYSASSSIIDLKESLSNAKKYLQPVLTVALQGASGDGRRAEGWGEIRLDFEGESRAETSVHLQGVWLNLIQNAIEAGSTEVDVTVREREDSVEVKIIDHGKGMTAGRLREVLEGETQSDKGGKHQGLGVQLCREIVEAQGGRFGMTSREGEGTAVSITLPTAASLGARATDKTIMHRARATLLSLPLLLGIIPSSPISAAESMFNPLVSQSSLEPSAPAIAEKAGGERGLRPVSRRKSKEKWILGLGIAVGTQYLLEGLERNFNRQRRPPDDALRLLTMSFAPLPGLYYHEYAHAQKARDLAPDNFRDARLDRIYGYSMSHILMGAGLGVVTGKLSAGRVVLPIYFPSTGTVNQQFQPNGRYPSLEQWALGNPETLREICLAGPLANFTFGSIRPRSSSGLNSLVMAAQNLSPYGIFDVAGFFDPKFRGGVSDGAHVFRDQSTGTKLLLSGGLSYLSYTRGGAELLSQASPVLGGLSALRLAGSYNRPLEQDFLDENPVEGHWSLSVIPSTRPGQGTTSALIYNGRFDFDSLFGPRQKQPEISSEDTMDSRATTLEGGSSLKEITGNSLGGIRDAMRVKLVSYRAAKIEVPVLLSAVLMNVAGAANAVMQSSRPAAVAPGGENLDIDFRLKEIEMLGEKRELQEQGNMVQEMQAALKTLSPEVAVLGTLTQPSAEAASLGVYRRELFRKGSILAGLAGLYSLAPGILKMEALAAAAPKNEKIPPEIMRKLLSGETSGIDEGVTELFRAGVPLKVISDFMKKRLTEWVSMATNKSETVQRSARLKDGEAEVQKRDFADFYMMSRILSGMIEAENAKQITGACRIADILGSYDLEKDFIVKLWTAVLSTLKDGDGDDRYSMGNQLRDFLNRWRQAYADILIQKLRENPVTGEAVPKDPNMLDGVKTGFLDTLSDFLPPLPDEKELIYAREVMKLTVEGLEAVKKEVLLGNGMPVLVLMHQQQNLPNETMFETAMYERMRSRYKGEWTLCQEGVTKNPKDEFLRMCGEFAKRGTGTILFFGHGWFDQIILSDKESLSAEKIANALVAGGLERLKGEGKDGDKKVPIDLRGLKCFSEACMAANFIRNLAKALTAEARKTGHGILIPIDISDVGPNVLGGALFEKALANLGDQPFVTVGDVFGEKVSGYMRSGKFTGIRGEYPVGYYKTYPVLEISFDFSKLSERLRVLGFTAKEASPPDVSPFTYLRLAVQDEPEVLSRRRLFGLPSAEAASLGMMTGGRLKAALLLPLSLTLGGIFSSPGKAAAESPDALNPSGPAVQLESSEQLPSSDIDTGLIIRGALPSHVGNGGNSSSDSSNRSASVAQVKGDAVETPSLIDSARLSTGGQLINGWAAVTVAHWLHEYGHVDPSGGSLSLTPLDLLNPTEILRGGDHGKVYGRIPNLPRIVIGIDPTTLPQWGQGDSKEVMYSQGLFQMPQGFYDGLSSEERESLMSASKQLYDTNSYPTLYLIDESGSRPVSVEIVTADTNYDGHVSREELLAAIGTARSLRATRGKAANELMLHEAESGLLMTREAYKLLDPVDATQTMELGQGRAFVGTLGLFLRSDLQVQLAFSTLGFSNRIVGRRSLTLYDRDGNSVLDPHASLNDLDVIGRLSKFSPGTVKALAFADFVLNYDEFKYLWDVSRGRSGKLPRIENRLRFSFDGSTAWLTLKASGNSLGQKGGAFLDRQLPDYAGDTTIEIDGKPLEGGTSLKEIAGNSLGGIREVIRERQRKQSLGKIHAILMDFQRSGDSTRTRDAELLKEIVPLLNQAHAVIGEEAKREFVQILDRVARGEGEIRELYDWMKKNTAMKDLAIADQWYFAKKTPEGDGSWGPWQEDRYLYPLIVMDREQHVIKVIETAEEVLGGQNDLLYKGIYEMLTGDKMDVLTPDLSPDLLEQRMPALTNFPGADSRGLLSLALVLHDYGRLLKDRVKVGLDEKGNIVLAPSDPRPYANQHRVASGILAESLLPKFGLDEFQSGIVALLIRNHNALWNLYCLEKYGGRNDYTTMEGVREDIERTVNDLKTGEIIPAAWNENTLKSALAKMIALIGIVDIHTSGDRYLSDALIDFAVSFSRMFDEDGEENGVVGTVAGSLGEAVSATIHPLDANHPLSALTGMTSEELAGEIGKFETAEQIRDFLMSAVRVRFETLREEMLKDIGDTMKVLEAMQTAEELIEFVFSPRLDQAIDVLTGRWRDGKVPGEAIDWNTEAMVSGIRLAVLGESGATAAMAMASEISKGITEEQIRNYIAEVRAGIVRAMQAERDARVDLALSFRDNDADTMREILGEIRGMLGMVFLLHGRGQHVSPSQWKGFGTIIVRLVDSSNAGNKRTGAAAVLSGIKEAAGHPVGSLAANGGLIPQGLFRAMEMPAVFADTDAVEGEMRKTYLWSAAAVVVALSLLKQPQDVLKSEESLRTFLERYFPQSFVNSFSLEDGVIRIRMNALVEAVKAAKEISTAA